MSTDDSPADDMHIPTFTEPDCVRRVGYLRRGEPFETGEVDERVFERLCELTQDPWSPWAYVGVHFCDLCRFTGNCVGHYQKISGSTKLRSPGYAVSAVSATCELWVPGDGLLWVCPTSITHYIDAHGYAPPAAFCEAALACPPMRSMAYFRAILANGGRGLGISGSLRRGQMTDDVWDITDDDVDAVAAVIFRSGRRRRNTVQ